MGEPSTLHWIPCPSHFIGVQRHPRQICAKARSNRCLTKQVHLSSRPVPDWPFPIAGNCTYRPTRENRNFRSELHKQKGNSIAKGRDRSFRRPNDPPSQVDVPLNLSPPSRTLQTPRTRRVAISSSTATPVLPPSFLPPPARIPFHPILILHPLLSGQIATAPADSATVTTLSFAHSAFFRGTSNDILHTLSAGSSIVKYTPPSPTNRNPRPP